MFSDRCPLNEPDKVTAIQEKMVVCLRHLLNVRHGGPGTLFYKIFSLMTDLRGLANHEAQFAKTLLAEPVVSDRMSSHYSLMKEFLTQRLVNDLHLSNSPYQCVLYRLCCSCYIHNIHIIQFEVPELSLRHVCKGGYNYTHTSRSNNNVHR